MRTTVRSGSRRVSSNAALAAFRSLAATPSSRSRITTSAAAAAFSNRSGRSAGQNNHAGPVCVIAIFAPHVRRALLLLLRTLAHHRLSRCGRHDVTVLVAAGVRERHDALAGAALGLAFVGHLSLG